MRHLVKGGVADALVSLETPVLYFYTDRDRTASVHVEFPKGSMTDWYPQTSRPPSRQLRWDNIRVLAKDRPALSPERDPRRYFAARETDAATVQATNPDTKKLENEKFLFYRGVGDFEMPLEVRAKGQGAFTIKNTGRHAVPGHFLVSVQDRKVSFAALGQLASGAEEKAALPAEASTSEKLADAMVKLLVEQGLYEKEARAMVKTWQADWFGENGTRVLYLVAETVTEELLPLKIDPKPDRLVRVLVGRHDILTPEREAEVGALVKRLNGESNADAKAADTALSKLGRYRFAAQTAAERRASGR
ncbi:hypothetical protein [Limnoglobus roseus]|uniref:Uncharacterized protein n=1 Tax=Limnoglobus roseus TaxID=2598579 RepID=A0A5C1AMD4_9BACT|nr:hypothetical protein [Limnoglobus roseus]QEL20130.1 hypothetical protein PX52LOC_07218 [Limnoglobus roseus]